MKTTARQIFKSVVSGKNFMTPNIKGYYKINDTSAIELTTGKGFTGNTLYGVTVVLNGEHNNNLSQSFNTEYKAMDYIKTLKSKYKNC